MYAFGQVELGANTSRHRIFQIIGGEATGVYRFVTGFFGLTTLPTEIQRITDLTHAGITNTFAFVDDILIVTHGTEDEHIEKMMDFTSNFTCFEKKLACMFPCSM